MHPHKEHNMIDIDQIERTVTTLRQQAQSLNTAADSLEASIQPWKIMQQNMSQMQNVMSTWVNMWQPPKS